MKKKKCQQRIVSLAKLFFKNGAIKTLPVIQKLWEFITTRPGIQERLKGVLQVEMKRHETVTQKYRKV